MTLIVQKYGGTSLSHLDKIKHVAQMIKDARNKGNQIIVVLSAVERETDRLIAMAQAMAGVGNGREYDALLATGEQISVTLMVMALEKINCPAVSLNAWQLGVLTDNHHKKARIKQINCSKLREILAGDVIPVVTGFQGLSAEGEITTLGRGGSDTTAVAIAAAMQAKECQIYTDVAGVYTTDPKIIPEAQLLQRISSEEMLEFASLGAKVLQTRAVEVSHQHRVPVRILPTFVHAAGTLVTLDGPESNRAVTGVVFDTNQVKISLNYLPNEQVILAECYQQLSEQEIEVDMISQQVWRDNTSMDIQFTINQTDYVEVISIMSSFARRYPSCQLDECQDLVKLSVVGSSLRSHPQIRETVFSELSNASVNIYLTSSSETRLSVLISYSKLDLCVRILHNAFDLTRNNVGVREENEEALIG